MKLIIKNFGLLILISGWTDVAARQVLTIPQNQVIEWSYQSTKVYENPFADISVYASISTPEGNSITIPGYWAGGQVWSFRFSTPSTGKYGFTTLCSDPDNSGLHQQEGEIRVVRYQGDNPLYLHGPLKISTDHRHLVHQDGTPFFWLADSWWHGMTSRFKWPEDFKMLTADRKEKGFSVIQFAIGFPCDIAPFDPRGQNEAGDPWDTAMTTINPAYFDLVDHRIAWLVKEGIVPNIVGAWGYYIKWMGVERMRQHWKYLIARYGAYPVTWTLCGESTLAWYDDLGEDWETERKKFRQWWSLVAGFIQVGDPYDRILTVHPGPGTFDGKPPINDMNLIDMVMLQSGHDGFFTIPRAVGAVPEAMATYPNKPVLHGEVCFEGMKGSSWEDVQRVLFWSNMLQGTCGYSYGVEGIWQFNTEEQLFGPSPGGNTWGNVPWEVAFGYSGSRQVGKGKMILEKFEWWKLEPDQDLVRHEHTDAFGPYSARIGDEFIFVYIHRPPARWRQYWVQGMKAGREYQLIFYDPITGDQYDRGTVASSEKGEFLVPDVPISQDWVVVLREL
jgi:hypothetical protein